MKKLLFCYLILLAAHSHASEAPIEAPDKATASELVNMTGGDIKRIVIEKNTFLACKIKGMPKKVYYILRGNDKYVCVGTRSMVAVFQKGYESD